MPSASSQAVDLTRDRILEAAITQFGLHGIRRTSMEQVAIAAGLARSGVYRYFPSKPELIEGALLHELARFLLEFDRATRHLSDIADIAAESFVTAVEFGRNSPLLGGMLTGDSDELLPYLTTKGQSVIEIGREFIVDRLGRLMPTETPTALLEQAAETAVRLVESFLVNRHSVLDLEDPRAVRQYARRILAPIVLGLARPEIETDKIPAVTDH